ncbi:MAG: FxsA family protein [Deltaproteobacteria bacterium]
MAKPMGWLALLFIVVPALELAILMKVGALFGVLPTFALIVVTGIVGAALAKRQGLSVLTRLRKDAQTGAWPGTAIADGAIIVVAGALLVTPGMLTDLVGFSLLVPQVRSAIRGHLRRRFEQAVVEGRVQTFHTYSAGQESPRASGPVIDVTPPPRS